MSEQNEAFGDPQAPTHDVPVKRRMCECIVYHPLGNWHTFDPCAFKAKERFDVVTTGSFNTPKGEPRVIHVCGIHARELRKGKSVDRSTGKRGARYPHNYISEDVKLPDGEPGVD